MPVLVSRFSVRSATLQALYKPVGFLDGPVHSVDQMSDIRLQAGELSPQGTNCLGVEVVLQK